MRIWNSIFWMRKNAKNSPLPYPPLASLEQETSSWSYQHDRDLTGFIDGSENPTLLDAPVAALLPEGVPGAAGSVLLLQKWKHLVAEWEALPIDRQERIS